MPYQVIKEKSVTETPAKTRIQMAKELKGIPQGETVLGFIGTPPPLDEPFKETLTDDEINEKTKIQNLIMKYIQPPALGSKYTNKQCELRFVRKVNKLPLSDLRRIWGKPIPEDYDITPEAQADLQKNWEDVSP